MTKFVRDRFTWLAYLMLAYFSYLQAGMGPALTFLRQDLGMSYRIVGLHASAFALGMIVAGSFGSRLTRRIGRRNAFWLGAAGMALGAVGFVMARHPAFTILSTLVMGLLGGQLLVLIQSTLADRHGPRRATALTEANVIASVGAFCAPFLLGGLQVAVGWRVAYALAIPFLALAFMSYRQVTLPRARYENRAANPTEATTSTGRLPGVFWLLWCVVIAAVAMEWCVIFWGADFLEAATPLRAADAATAMSLFFVAVIISRACGSWLTHRFASIHLLLGALLIVAVGFPIFWLAPYPWQVLTGLFLSGLGIANLFPMTLAAATNIDPDRSDEASGRISLGAGLAILIAPQILGMMADSVGIRSAFGVVLVLLLCALALVLWVLRTGAALPEEPKSPIAEVGEPMPA